MEIRGSKISKRYDTGWVIKDLDFIIPSGNICAVKGPNGSGKSTLIQMLCGYLSSSKGEIIYSMANKEVKRDALYKYMSIVAAYSELDEELTPRELFNHFKVFKPYKISDSKTFLEICNLTKEKEKPVKNFSSGMKQRLLLALGVLMDTPLLILDEPSSFLDVERTKWMIDLIRNNSKGRTIVIASNDEKDLTLCNQEIVLF